MPLTIRAPAKINLHLRVFPAGGDGYHPLRSWFRTIELFDEVTIATAPKLAPGELALHSSDPALPADESNLVRRASRWVVRWAGLAAVLIALLLRLSADLTANMYMALIHASSGTWVLAALLWLGYALPKMRGNPAHRMEPPQ